MICSSNTSIKTLSLYKFNNLLIKLPWINYTIHFKHVIYVEQTTIATQLNINHVLRTNVHLKPISDYASVTVVSIKGQPRILCIFLPRHTPATEAEIWIQEYGTKYTVLKLKITDRYLVTFIFTPLQPITEQYLVTLPSYFISQKTPNTAPMLD